MPRTRRSDVTAPELCPMRAASAFGPILKPDSDVAGGLTGWVDLRCDGVEVTQAIQNMAHVVPLVEKKQTVARVYLSAVATGPFTVQGVLRARRAGGAWVSVPSTGGALIAPAENGQLRLKRENETKSLNFILPKEVCVAGAMEVQLASVWQVSPAVTLTPPTTAVRSVTFVPSAPLRVRIVGIRFLAGGVLIAPTALDFALLRSWLGRAYPVWLVQWSQVTLDAPRAWPFVAANINTFLRGIRAPDIVGGMDRRTHYFGLVPDGGGGFFMRGQASGVPVTADPSTVASGPTGSGTFGWDTDGSYGDWYTGHELGHTFGRPHAEFCGAAEGAAYPFVNGQLSNADGAFVGFDMGDPSRALPMRALPGTVWHDLMTYCSNQWLSSFTYTAIRNRLNEENALPAGMPMRSGKLVRAAAAGGKGMAKGGVIHVVATMNLTDGSGRFQHVTPLPVATSGGLATRLASGSRSKKTGKPNVTVRAYAGANSVEYQVEWIPDACLDPGDDETGAVDAFIPRSASMTRLELVLNGTVLDTFSPGGTAGSVRNIRSAAPGAGRRGAKRLTADISAGDPDFASLSWDAPGRAGAAKRGLTAQAESSVYSVQISIDGGKTWETVGFDLREPRVAIDRGLIGDAKTVKVRITSTDGFRSVTTEKNVKASDLA
jgi:hypothetical protein